MDVVVWENEAASQKRVVCHELELVEDTKRLEGFTELDESLKLQGVRDRLAIFNGTRDHSTGSGNNEQNLYVISADNKVLSVKSCTVAGGKKGKKDRRVRVSLQRLVPCAQTT